MPTLTQRIAAKIAAGKTALEYDPVSKKELKEAEGRLGFSLPPLLRELYLQIANGGFGPSYGIFGVTSGGHCDEKGRGLVDLYAMYRKPYDGLVRWPEKALIFCYWGCTNYSILDCSRSPFAVSMVDFSLIDYDDSPTDWSDIFVPHKPSLESWFTDWCEGVDQWGQVYKKTK